MATQFEQYQEIKKMLWDMISQLNWIVNKINVIESEIAAIKERKK